MRGIQHGTGDKIGEVSPALVDVPKSQPGGGEKTKVPKRKRKVPKLK